MKKVVIVGSGIGGLVAGNLLAKKGHRVTIFETHPTPGGYTAGFWRQGYYFESGTLSFESSAAVFAVMKALGVLEKIKFKRQKIGIHLNGKTWVCENHIDLRKCLYASYPREKKQLDGYFGEVDKMMKTMNAIMSPARIVDYLAYPVRLLASVYLYRKYSKVTVNEFTARFVDQDSELFSFLRSLGYPEMSAAIIALAIVSFFDDYWTVQDGMQSWADVLSDHFAQSGGKLKLNHAVDKIVTKNGLAAGVVSDGEFQEADYVIAACDYKKTFLKLLDDKNVLTRNFKEKVEQCAVSEGVVTVYLGLKLSNENLEKYLKNPHVMYFDEKTGYDIHDSDDLDFFTKTSISLYSPSLINPRLAPEQRSSLMIQAAAPYQWMANWGRGDKNRYRELKQRITDTLINKAAGVIPLLRENIEFKDAATPLTYERYTGNTDGATSAWSWNPKKRFYKNIVSVNIQTPIRNLLIGSCWSCQIGGVPSAISAAVKCAKAIS